MKVNAGEMPVLSIDEAASYIRASREHIYNLMRRGELTSVRAGHRRLIRRADIDRMLERRAEQFEPRPRREPRAAIVDIFA
ncbi:DNA binding domain protein, excisionase family [Rhizobium leguminosarum bv. trifolii WSM2304]|uniref:DNA binding domain protein, excisionase family n=2 Tax=Rhizobium leguminosarum TaxID=384 RepID=A0ABF7QTP9_RHILW|nr:DNA binding domain protein, excisionase family [Rhizobium leguminosarum bv. trifolii WSM2304]